MILGTGIDLCEVARMRRLYERFGERLLERIFTPVERAELLRRRDPAQGMAVRWAAKEAGTKALGTGFHQGVGWRDFEVVHEASGRPTLRVAGRAAQIADQRWGSHRWHVSLTHERDYACAVAIAETGEEVSR
jgi:holo-[acyl-carrier protein] synthase